MVINDVTNTQLDALKDLNSSVLNSTNTLEDILQDIAASGQYIFAWHYLKHLYLWKLEKVTLEFLDANKPLNEQGLDDEVKMKDLKQFRSLLHEMLDKFVRAPFTLQRLTELLLHPKKHYKNTVKFYRAIEKTLLVQSTIDPVLPEKRMLKRSYEGSNNVTNGYTSAEDKPYQKKSKTENENKPGETEPKIAETSEKDASVEGSAKNDSTEVKNDIEPEQEMELSPPKDNDKETSETSENLAKVSEADKSSTTEESEELTCNEVSLPFDGDKIEDEPSEMVQKDEIEDEPSEMVQKDEIEDEPSEMVQKDEKEAKEEDISDKYEVNNIQKETETDTTEKADEEPKTTDSQQTTS